MPLSVECFSFFPLFTHTESSCSNSWSKNANILASPLKRELLPEIGDTRLAPQYGQSWESEAPDFPRDWNETHMFWCAGTFQEALCRHQAAYERNLGRVWASREKPNQTQPLLYLKDGFQYRTWIIRDWFFHAVWGSREKVTAEQGYWSPLNSPFQGPIVRYVDIQEMSKFS